MQNEHKFQIRVKHLECGAGQKWRTMTTEEACNLFYEELEKGAE